MAALNRAARIAVTAPESAEAGALEPRLVTAPGGLQTDDERTICPAGDPIAATDSHTGRSVRQARFPTRFTGG